MADRQILDQAKKHLQLVPEAAPPRPAEAAATTAPQVSAPPAPPSPPATGDPEALVSPVGRTGGEARAFGKPPGNGYQAPPPTPRLRLAPAPPSSAPKADPRSWQDQPLELDEPPADPEAAAADWETEMARRMKSLTPVGLMVAESLVANFDRNRQLCEQLGMPWPRLSSAPEDAQFLAAFRDMYAEACKYTVALLLPARQGKYTPVVVCLGGQIGSTLAVQLAARRAQAAGIEQPNHDAQPDVEADIVQGPGSPGWRSPRDLAGAGGGDE